MKISRSLLGDSGGLFNPAWCQKEPPLTSVIVIVHDDKKYLKDCFLSVLNQDYPNYEVIMVDNASKDGSADFVRKHFPSVKIVRSSVNRGYSGGNNLGFIHSAGDFIVVLNPDVVVADDWLSSLVMARLKEKKPCIVTSKVLLYDDPRKINACGNSVHYTGLVFCRGMHELEKIYCHYEEVAAPCGASFLIDRITLEKVGFMDEDLFSNMSDTDLAFRIRLIGGKCVVASSSVVLHKFRLKMTPMRFYVLEKERYALLFKNYSSKLLKVTLLGLVLTEILTWGFALIKGKEYVRAKLCSYKAITKNLKKIREKRKEIATLKRAEDSWIFGVLDSAIKIPEEWLSNISLIKALENVFNTFYQIHFNLAKIIIEGIEKL